MYGLENQYLNQPADTAWYNLGDWSGGVESYPEACEQLARRMALQAGFSPGETLFDIGCGCGEQDLFWSSVFQLSNIDAITLPGPQLDWARRRLEVKGLGSRVHIEGQALEDLRKLGMYDHVTALDAAYHFSKENLFARAADLTTPGSRLSFTDLVRKSPDLEPGTRRILGFGGIHPEHLGTQSELDAWASGSGFALSSSRDLSAEVMKGFSEFVRRERSALVRSAGFGALRFLLTGWGLGYLYRQGSLTYRLLVYART